MSASSAAAEAGGGVWQWGRWHVSEDQLPLAVGALAGGALLILAIIAAAVWRCCTLSPRNAKASHRVRIGDEEAARQNRPRVAAVASHESAVYLDPKSNQWSHNSRLVVTTATATSPTGTDQSVQQSTQTCTTPVSRSGEVTKGGQAVIVSHPQPQCSTEEEQPDPRRQAGSHHASHPPPLPPQHVTRSMGSLTMTPPPHWFYDGRVLSQSTLERLDPAALTSSPCAPQRVTHENGVTVWSGMGCDPSGRRRSLSQPSCYGPCNQHHNVQVVHPQSPAQFQQQIYHPSMQGVNNIQTSNHQQQMHHPHHHTVLSIPQHQQDTSGDKESQQPQQNHEVHLPEIPELCLKANQYASSGVLDEVSCAREYDVVGGEGLGLADGTSRAVTAALKTRSLPARLRSRSRPLSTEDDLAELYAKDLKIVRVFKVLSRK